jgi:hypothetical protein
MIDFLKELIGQDAQSQIDNETSKFNVGNQKVKRSAGERFFDTFLGRSEEIQELAKQKYQDSLKSTQGYQDLEILGKTPELTSYMTPGSLGGLARTAKKEEAIEDRKTNYRTDPARIKADADAKIERDYRRDTDAENTRRFNANQRATIDAQRDTTALGMAQLDITRQQEANRMAEETRRYNERRSDSKRERMAAIIAGLANLGGAFVI